MTKPTMELIEDHGEAMYEHGRLRDGEAYDTACALLSEIRQRLEAMERDAARYRWLRAQRFDKWRTIAWNLCPDSELVPYVAGLRDAAIDAAMAEGEAKP